MGLAKFRRCVQTGSLLLFCVNAGFNRYSDPPMEEYRRTKQVELHRQLQILDDDYSESHRRDGAGTVVAAPVVQHQRRVAEFEVLRGESLTKVT